MVSAIVARKPLPDVLFSIEISLEQLGWISISRQGGTRLVLLREPRLLFWAIASLEKSGLSPERIASHLEQHPVERHWWLLRQLLPDAALYALESKLLAALELEESSDG